MDEGLHVFKNKLVVFEGEDHTGKTTIAKMLVERMSSAGIPAIFTFQPGDPAYGPLAPTLASLCKKKEHNLDTLGNLFAFLLDRAEHTAKVVTPALNEGKAVICDRWWYSTYCYQFHGKELKHRFMLTDDFIATLNMFASHWVEPDFVFYFDRPQGFIDGTPDDAQDRFESEDLMFKRRVHLAYLELIKKHHFNKVKVDRDPEVTLSRLMDSSEWPGLV